MDPKEQLRQVEAEMARDAEEANRLSRTDAAGGSQPPTGRWIWGGGSGDSIKRPGNGQVFAPAGFAASTSANTKASVAVSLINTPTAWNASVFDCRSQGGRPIGFECGFSHVWLPLGPLNLGAKWTLSGPFGLKAGFLSLSRAPGSSPVPLPCIGFD